MVDPAYYSAISLLFIAGAQSLRRTALFCFYLSGNDRI